MSWWGMAAMAALGLAYGIREYRFSPERLAEDTYGDPIAGAILKAGDLRVLRAQMLKARDDWSRRYFYSLAMSRRFPERKLKRWAEKEPDSADAQLVYGARLLRQALAVRGYGRAQGIGEKQAQKFFALLERTEGVLQRAAELHPKDPTPWAYLIAVGFHLHGSANPFVEQRYFEEATARDPDNWHAHMHRLIGVSKKYGGSHDMMFELARSAGQNAAPGSLLRCLILKAHLEYWKYLLLFDDDSVAAEAYAQNPDVIAECLAAYNDSLATREDGGHDTLLVSINAAGVFWIFRQKEPLRRELERLGDRLQDVHWSFLAAPGDLARAKQFAFS